MLQRTGFWPVSNRNAPSEISETEADEGSRPGLGCSSCVIRRDAPLDTAHDLLDRTPAKQRPRMKRLP